MITAAICAAFKRACLPTAAGVHLAGDDYRIALYTADADLSKATTVYTPDGEVVGAGYVAGGARLAGLMTGLDGDTAWLDWTTDPTWSEATIKARGALIYNRSKGNQAIAVLDFGKDCKSQNGTFAVVLPPPGATTAVVRLS